MSRRPIVIIAVVAAAVLLLGGFLVMRPQPETPSGDLSQRYYLPGPHQGTSEEISLTDSARPTAANREFSGSDVRLLEGHIYYPTDQEGAPWPLLVYSHGYMSQHTETEYLLDFLVSHGYVVIAVDYPLTSGSAPGGPALADVVNQPADISFLIDYVLARSQSEQDPLHGLVDRERIATLGLSLGGLTTELVAFHRDLRDPRIRAAISMAGPSEFMTAEFFATSDLSLMYVAGEADALVPYSAHAATIPDRVPNSILVTLRDGTHVGFVGMAAGPLRWLHNPDELGCIGLMSGLEAEEEAREEAQTKGEAPDQDVLALADLFDPASGFDMTRSTAPCEMEEFPRAMRPLRQQTLTELAVLSFLQSHLAAEPATRREMSEYLLNHLAAENPDLTIRTGSAFR